MCALCFQGVLRNVLSCLINTQYLSSVDAKSPKEHVQTDFRRKNHEEDLREFIKTPGENFGY